MTKTALPRPDARDAPAGAIEIALLVCGEAGGPLLALTDRAAAAVRARLAEALPEFDWRISVAEVRKAGLTEPLEPVELLVDPAVAGAAEGSDFTLVVTDRDLAAHYRATALAAPSQATASAVVSTCRLAEQEGEGRIAERLAALCLQLLARLNGLEAAEADPSSFAAPIESAAGLDRLSHWSERDRAQLRDALVRVADPRIEERGGLADSRLAFFARALWENRREFLRAVQRARPWLFPLHLRRLTTAALSTLLVLMMTAEAWDLALRQPVWKVAALSLAALAGTSAFVLARQQLLIRRTGRRLTERRVLSNAATVAVVLSGFTATYALLFAVTGGFAGLFFEPALIVGWATSAEASGGPRPYLLMSGFVASLGIVIGALGASFEARSHFRHVAFIDEEI